MPATATGRGAQVVLDGNAQKAARGAYAATYEGNSQYLAGLQLAGTVADGSRPDGSTLTGGAASDFLVVELSPTANLSTTDSTFAAQEVYAGPGTALATTATAGYLYIPTCAGTPTVAPTNAAVGRAAVVYDTAANKLWFNVGGTWRGVVVT